MTASGEVTGPDALDLDDLLADVSADLPDAEAVLADVSADLSGSGSEDAN